MSIEWDELFVIKLPIILAIILGMTVGFLMATR
jgi:hypothetical protein